MKKHFLLPLILGIALLLVGCTTSLPAVGGPTSGTETPGERPQPIPTPTPTPDPWTQAVTETQSVLADADLDAHFQYYQDTADKIDDYLAQLEKIRPALKLIDTLKDTNIPILGNVWDLIIKALDKAFLGAGIALEQVDEGLRDLLDSHYRLQRLDELDQTLAAVQAFQANPSRETLEPLGEEMARADFILAGVDKDAAALQEKVDALVGAIETVQTGLGLVSGLAPQIQEPLQEIQQFIAEIAAPIQGLAKTLETMRSQIAEDRDVFWQIQDIIEKAKNPPNSIWLPTNAQVLSC